MRKVTALYVNEMTKVTRKVSVLVILIIMTVGVIGYGLLIRLSASLISGPILDSPVSDDILIDEQITYNQTELERVQEQLSASEDAGERSQLREESYALQAEIDRLQLARDNDIPIYSGGDYRDQLLSEFYQLDASILRLQDIPAASRSASQQADLSAYSDRVAELINAIEQDDFRFYIDVRNQQIADDASLSADDKKVMLASNELWFEADPTGSLSGNAYYSLQSALSQYVSYNQSLLANRDFTAASATPYPLTPATRAEITNKLAALTYRLQNGLVAGDVNGLSLSDLACRGMLGFGLFMIVLLMMIQAGGSISQEIATGSIKSLIIAPVRRWKIFAAKVLSLLSTGLAAVLYLYALSMLVRGLLFGFLSGQPYVFAVNGTVGVLEFHLFMLGYLLVNFIDVLVYMTLALMLSAVTRNTALSVGVSVGTYFVGSLIGQGLSILAMFGQSGEWTKFVPFNNLSLAGRVFSFDSYSDIFSASNSLNGLSSSAGTPSILFSLVYLAVLIFCLGFTARDSFVKRDI